MGVYYFYGFLRREAGVGFSVYNVGKVLTVVPGFVYKGVVYGSVLSSLGPADVVRGLLLWGESFGGFSGVELYAPGHLDYWVASWEAIRGRRHVLCDNCMYGALLISVAPLDAKLLMGSGLSAMVGDLAERLTGVQPGLSSIRLCRLSVSRLGEYFRYTAVYSGDNKDVYIVLQYLAFSLPLVLGVGRVFMRIIWRRPRMPPC